MATEYKNINTIPYTAPLSFTLPTKEWIKAQTRKGNKNTFVPTDPLPEVDCAGKNIIISGGNNGIGKRPMLSIGVVLPRS